MISKNQKQKYLLILLLLISVTGITLGFAAYQRTLTIKSSATVTPDSNNFSVQFSSSTTELKTGDIKPYFEDPVVASDATITNGVNPTISGINISFTEPGQTANYFVNILNTGKYDAYLNEIKFNNAVIDGVEQGSSIVCKAKEDASGNLLATQSLVDEACNGIIFRVELYNEEGYAYLYDETTQVEEKLFSPWSTTNTGTAWGLDIVLGYSGNVTVDGPFDVIIGDVELIFSSVDVNAN